MEYYPSSRGRSSFRGGSTRGSRGAFRGSRFAPRGSRGGSSSFSSVNKYQPSTYGSDGNKFSSSSSTYSRRAQDEYYSRRPDSFSTREREHRTELGDLASRKRERTDSYSQGVSRRDDSYRSSDRRFDSSASRSYEEPRQFKKPRSEFKPDYKSEHRVKEPLRARVPGLRGRGSSFASRGSFSSRRPRMSSYRGRTVLPRSSTSGPASTSEILAIRRAKLLQKRIKDEQTSSATTEPTDNADVKIKDEVLDVTLENPPPEEATNAVGGTYRIKLECPACHIKCVTFREYAVHLHQPVHLKAMDQNVDTLKASLVALRLKQRELQKQIEADDLESLETVTNYCPTCRLNYSQAVDVHEASDLHKELKEMLSPSCKTCHLTFHSPLIYEKHLCSLNHLKRKDLIEQRVKHSLPASGILDRFMVLDSVGSGDDEKEEDKEVAADVATAANDEAEDLNLGVEFIHDVQAKYCEVCRVYLRRDDETSIMNHCRTKEHLRCYLHFGTDDLLEKIQRADNKDKLGDAEEPLDEAKLWDDNDDDQPAIHKSDDDDEEQGCRFDRINSKEKSGNGETLGEEMENGDGDDLAAVEGSVEGVPSESPAV